MKILVTGGGTGGHITPVLAVAHELKQLRPDIHITYVGQIGDSLGDIPEQDKNIDDVVNPFFPAQRSFSPVQLSFSAAQ